MKFVVLFCLLLVAFGLRHTHKSQYELGYEAGLRDAAEYAEELGTSLQAEAKMPVWYCVMNGYKGCFK